MASSAPELEKLLAAAGFKCRQGAMPAEVARLAAALAVQLPDEFVELWTLTDGATGYGIDLYPLQEIKKYAGVFSGGLGYVPLTDCNDSNPYVLCCNEPLRGMVAHIYHDDEPELVCRGLRRFLELIAEAQGDGDVSRLNGDFDFATASREAGDAVIADELMRSASNLDVDDEWRGITLHFAAQLLGAGNEKELARLMELGTGYTRDDVRRRWKSLKTPEAMSMLRVDDAAYRKFVQDFKQSLAAC